MAQDAQPKPPLDAFTLLFAPGSRPAAAREAPAAPEAGHTLADERRAGSIENAVLIGTDGHLFLAGGSHNVFGIVTGQLRVPEESFKAFDDNIRHRAAWAAERSVPYMHLIFPDKQSVLVDSWPMTPPVRIGQLYVDRAGALAAAISYPAAMLAKLGSEAYWKTDTHLTDTASIQVSMDIAEFLSQTPMPALRRQILAATASEARRDGDLGSKLTPPVSSVAKVCTLPPPGPVFTNNIEGGNNGLIDLRFNPKAPINKRVVYFGDSFGREMCRFLQFAFAEVLFFRTPFFHEDVAQFLMPDILISENVERYLDHVMHDAERPFFFMYPHFKGLYQPPADFAEALSAVMSTGRRAYEKFALKLALPPRGQPVTQGNATWAKPIRLSDWLPTDGESREIEAPHVRPRPRPAFILNLSGRDVADWYVPLQDIHGTNCINRRNVLLFGPNHLIDANGAWSCESRSFKRQFLDYATTASFRAGFPGRPVRVADDGGAPVVTLDPTAALTPIRIAEKIFLATPLEPNNWGRWVATVFPKILYFQENCPDRRLLCQVDAPWQKTFLATLGIAEDRILPHRPGEIYLCDDVMTLDYSVTNMTVSGTERAMFLSWIGEAPHKAPAGGTRLFISRQGHTSRNPGYRMLVNEQELAAHLTREGYSVYEPERDPPALQWQRFNEADQIVALGGAALYNCAFCRPGTPVVTIESSTDFVRPHSDLLSSLDLKFALVIGRQDANDPTPVHKRWFVDAAAVAKAVHSF